MKIINPLLITCLLAIPTYFGIVEMLPQMTLSIVSCSLALAFVNLERFSKIKGAGFEAELKEAVTKVYAAVEELKDLGLALTAPVIDTIAVSGRMLQYIPLTLKLARTKQIENVLVKLGANEEEIANVCASIYQRVTTDHLRMIGYGLKECNSEKQEVFEKIAN